MLDLGQWLRSRVLVQEDPDVGRALLHAVNGLLVWSTDSASFNGVDLVDEAVRLIGQLTNNVVPLSEALVAAVAVREGSRESTGADITARSGHTVNTDTVTADFVTLLLGDTVRVTVAR